MNITLEDAIKKHADFIEKLEYDCLTEKSINQAKLILLDSLGCIAAGVKQYNVKELPQGAYTVIGNGTTDKYTATFINGASMVKNELDEGNQFAFGHPGCHIIPALLSETEEKSYSGKEVITALVAAYEISCRYGCSLKTKSAMHVHGTSQTMGATAVVGKLRGNTAEKIVKAIITAESLPQATSWQSAFNGDQLRNGYIGLSNIVGMNSYLMNEIGVSSSIETMTDVWERVLDGGINIEKLIEGLGEDFYIEKNYFKIHTACRYTHCFADMAIDLLKQGLDYRKIERIDIDTYSAAAKLKGQKANNGFAMKFSIPVALATCLVFGDLAMDTVTEENIKDARVTELAKKIYVTENEEYTKLLPETRANHMVISLCDGSTLEKQADVTKGDYKDPFSDEEVIHKFRTLTGRVWSKENQDKIVKTILELEKVQDFQEVMKLLA